MNSLKEFFCLVVIVAGILLLVEMATRVLASDAGDVPTPTIYVDNEQ